LLDFVRLEVGIWTVLLKQAEPRVAEALVRELLTRETIGPGTGLAFKGNGQGIDAALQGSMKIRDASRAVADGDDSWFEQYRAMHTLLALLALRRPEDHYLSFAVFAAVPPAVNRS
jgi:hypothetical protein